MNEPTVPVPASLIERIRDTYTGRDHVAADAAVSALLALLSQPTSTAAPCTCPPPATHLGEGPDQDCAKHGDRRAALTTRPSNAEKVPGHPADEFASTPLQPYLDQLNAEVRRMTKRNGSDGG